MESVLLTFFSFLNLGNPTRCLATKDPTFDTYLPVDDFAWDNGVSSYATQPPLGSRLASNALLM